MWERRSGSAIWRAERFTATETGAESGSKLLPGAAWRQACSITQRPIGTISRDSSATGMKDSGATRPRLGVVPAQQRFHGDDRSVAQLDDRLVVELELLALDRAPQVVLDLHVLDHAGAHHLVEDLVATAAMLLGAVEGRIGVPDQRLAAPRCPRRSRFRRWR